MFWKAIAKSETVPVWRKRSRERSRAWRVTGPPKKVLEFVEEPGKIIGGRKKKGTEVDKRMVPLASRVNKEAASK